MSLISRRKLQLLMKGEAGTSALIGGKELRDKGPPCGSCARNLLEMCKQDKL